MAEELKRTAQAQVALGTQTPHEARGLLLTGGVGVGKTTIAVELGVLLGQRRIEHAVVDLDWLSWGTASFDENQSDHRRRLLVENLHVVWTNYMRHGVRHLVLAGSIISPAHLEGVRQALNDMPLRVVRVRAPFEQVAARLHRRDAASKTVGSSEDLRTFEQLVAMAGVESSVVDNGTSDPSQVAIQLAAEWLSDPELPRPTAPA
jgi:adenylylsulfate kinase-like enzyme